MESMLIALLIVGGIVVIVSFIAMAFATLFAFMGGNFEPIEPKGTVEREKTEGKN